MLSKTDRAGARRWGVAVLATLALAAALRFTGLNSGLWFDEIATLVESVRLPLSRILTEFPGVNAHPLFSVLAHVSLQIFGESAWALRLPAALFGVATVGMVYVLAVRLTSRPEAWAGAALLATSYHHIWFSQNARGYTLLGFLTLLSTHLLLRALDAEGRPRDYVLYALACAAGVYTHLTMAFVVAGHALVIMAGWTMAWRPAATVPVTPVLSAWTGAAMLSALAYAPFMANLVAVMGVDAPRQAAQVATASWALSEAVRQLLSGAGVPAALTVVALAAAGAVSVWRRHPLAFALLVAPGAITAAIIVALGQPLRPRFFFFLGGTAVIFAGRGIGVLVDALAWRRAGRRERSSMAMAGVTMGLVALSALGLPRNYRLPKQDFEGAVRFLDAAEAQGARVTAAGPACFPLEAYFDRASWRCLQTIEDWREVTTDTVRVLVVHTLTDYVDDPALRAQLRTACSDVERFPGTLGGGDMVVCEAHAIGPGERLQGGRQ